jgi:hypothetical protein
MVPAAPAAMRGLRDRVIALPLIGAALGLQLSSVPRASFGNPPAAHVVVPGQACRVRRAPGLARQGWRSDALGRKRSQEARSGRRSLGRSRVTNPIRPAAMAGTAPLAA